MPKKYETVKIAVVGTGSTGNAYLVTVGDSKILLDAGMPAAKVRKFNNNKLCDIDAFLVTHTHKDHSEYIDEYIKMGVRFIYSETPIDCEKFIVYPDMQFHDVPCRGYSIDFPKSGIMLHYVTDTAAISISDEYLHKANRLHYWIVECDYCEETMDYNAQNESYVVRMRNMRTRDTHLSDRRVVDYFKQEYQVFADAILFVHRSFLNFDNMLFRREWREQLPKLNMDIAENGARYEMQGKTIARVPV